ncbi:conserved hypothetical protein [Pantoea brenneri]|uniref:Uncharacterized protein n=1 Tax=Pantoea brenneri TaxID=472694 RepID=A0AAX3J5A4_9GAMM|nr:hypothetical protein [Pantoea brenneri]VXB74092.1 conserved hypothetical protein [Pantoea brenneri]
MSEFKGTPGPWKWFTSNSHKRLSSVLSGKDGDVLYAYNDSTGFPMIGCNERDMALIAAAPELLEALQDAEKALFAALDNAFGEEMANGNRELIQARAAIAKALGQ